MGKYQLLLPKMGESVAEATIIKWNKAVGDTIEADDAVLEIATDKVDSEVPSPVGGRLLEQRCQENQVVQVGAVIAVIETADVEESLPEAKPVQPASAGAQLHSHVAPVQGTESIREPMPAGGVDDGLKSSSRFYSPLVKNIAAQEGLRTEDLDSIPGTGAEGRLTKDDLLAYIQNSDRSGSSGVMEAPAKQEIASADRQPAAGAHSGQAKTASDPKPIATAAVGVSGADEIIEMDRMRRLIAEHMVMSKQTAPHVTSFVEADVTAIVRWREEVKGSFEKKGEKITYTPVFIEAVVRAIKDYPMINVSVNGNQIIKKSAINIGMATALPDGNLIVPVIKKAGELNLIGLTRAVNDLAARARSNKLLPDEVKEGTFTVTNVGSFGNLMGTPIINQPQVAILAVGAIKKKPAVIETPQGDMIAIRHMMFLSLSYDHRVVDGALGGAFLRRIAEYLEGWDRQRAL